MAALVVAVMAVVFVLAVGPRLRGIEREHARLQHEMDSLRQEMARLQREIAQAREELQAPRTQAKPSAPSEIEVTAAENLPTSLRELQARLAIMDARQTRLYERFNRLVADLKASNVDLGITDRGP